MRVSLITTVLNEDATIVALLDSIAAQTRLPNEVVVVDGGSQDKTLAVLESYRERLPLIIKTLPGSNISQGRNAAISAASGEVIAVTDAGVRLHPSWLERLLAPLEAGSDVRAVAGFFVPDVNTPFEVAMGATVLPTVNDINPASFLPSSRSVAFRAEAWSEVGGYPDWLDFCEDLVFDFNLKAHYGAFEFAPDAIVYFRPRHTLSAFVKQYFLYARGDGKANLWFKRHLARYGTYLVAVPLIALAGMLLSLWWLLLYVAGGVYMFTAGYRRLPGLWRDLKPAGKIQAALWVPVIRVAGDLAKMSGYPVGVLWRVREQPPDWRIKPRSRESVP